MDEKMLQTIEISKQVKVLVDLAKKTNMEPSVLIGFIIAEFGQDVIDVDIPSSVFGKEDEEKDETVAEETEPVEVQIDVEKPKQPIGSVKIAQQIAEKNGKGFSYFGKFFINKREFQKKLHLTGDIKRYVDQEMEKGRSLEESVEEWCHNNIFDIMSVTFNKKTYNMSNYIKRAGIAAGYVRAEKLESPSISWEKALKRIISKMKLNTPKQEELEDIVTPYQFMITPVNKEKESKPSTRKIPVDYKGKHYDSKIDFYISNHIYGQYQKEVRSYETSGLFKDTGDAFDHFLSVRFSNVKDIKYDNIEFEDLAEFLDFYNIEYSDFWNYLREHDIRLNHVHENLKVFSKDNPKYFKKSFKINEVHKMLQQPVEFEGQLYSSGMNLIKLYGINMVQAIGTMAERGLTPIELIKYHMEDGEFINAKDTRLKEKKEPNYTGQQKLAHQSWSKAGVPARSISVTYDGIEYRSVQDGCDQLGIAQDCNNVRRRMRNGMSFEEAVDDVLMNKSNRGRKKKKVEEDFVYEKVHYNTLFDACKVYNVKESSVRNYAKDYGVRLDIAFGIIVGDIEEKDVGINKKRAYQTK